MAPFQIEIDDIIEKWHKLLVNKSKKIGITAGVLRSIARRCWTTYAGHEVMLCAGNREVHSKSLMERFVPLMEKFHDNIVEQTDSHMLLTNGTEINAYPSNAEATVGRPNVICVYLDEAAYTGVLNDYPIYENLLANLSNTNGDFIITSTPNNRRGFFFDLCNQPPDNWRYLQYDYIVGKQAMILSEEFIEEMKHNPMIDFDKLYRCQFPQNRLSAIDTETLKNQIVNEYSFEV